MRAPSPEFINRIRVLHAAGMTFLEIAVMLATTKGRVVGCHRRHILGIRDHHQGKRRAPRPKLSIEEREARRRDAEARREQQRLWALQRAQELAQARDERRRAAAERLLAALRAPIAPTRRCQYPHGHPGKPGFRFCGAPAAAGKSYCSEHHKVCHQPRGARLAMPEWAAS